MKAPEFDSLNKSIGEKKLSPARFEYKNGGWHCLTKEYQLSLILGKDRNASYSQVKYLTLCLRHLDVQWGKGGSSFKPYSSLDRDCPVQISPEKLETFVSTGFKSEYWRYSNTHAKIKSKLAYQAIYFGGIDKWVMKDKSFSVEENRRNLKRNVETYGAELITDEDSCTVLTKAISNVAKYGIRWAEFMTPIEIIGQIKSNGDDWFVENNWTEAYKQAFPVLGITSK